MAYTNNNGQARVGVRIVPLSVVIPTISALLDSYSGASAAYSLRKLKSSYTGSAIRVRRSSDNTEMNIGFDSNGNLDTYSLSAFVGTGNGFVSIWYDQSGSYNLIQTTAANQPSIILSGSINTQNGKPVLITDGSSFMVNNSVSWSSTTNSIFATIKLTSTRGYVAILSSVGTSNQHFVSRNVNGTGRYYDSGGQEITAAALPNGFNLIGIHENTSGVTVFENGANLVTNFAHDTVGTLTGIVVFRRDNDAGNVMRSDSGFSELVIYGTSKLSDNSVISNNINTYYSAYPNPTSVWNLLNAVYSADTIASSSLKTSLVASYNGESNTNDSFGTNNGTPQGGLTYGTGKIGNAFTFNGTNAYVSLPNNSLNSLTTDFSVSGWIYMPANTSSLYCVLLSNVSNDYTTGKGWSVFTYGNNIYFDVYYSGVYQVPNSAYVRLQANNTLTNNAWNHVTITRKNSTSSKIYINGSLVGSNTSIQNPATPTAAITPTIGVLSSVGVGNPLSSYAPNGTKIDALNIWTKELTASEVSELYNSGNGAQYIGDNFYKPTTNDALNTHNGTAQGGLTYGVGKVGTAFVGNGTNGYVSLPVNNFNFTGDFSISCWFKTSTVSGNQMIFSNLMYNGGARKGYYIALVGGAVEVMLANQPSSTQLIATTSVISINTWYNIVLVRESGVVKIYLNGTLLITDTNAISLSYITTTPSIGAYTNGVTTIWHFNGIVDALNVWQKSLTQSEITELYNSGNGKQYPN